MQDTVEQEAKARTLLIVEDDAVFLVRLARAMERRGFTVRTAESVADGMAAAREDAPSFAIVDLRLGDGSGLDVVAALREVKPDTRVIVLTGYGNIAAAAAPVHAGAGTYPSKTPHAATNQAPPS